MMDENPWYPFESEDEENAYIEKMGLKKYACTKHGLEMNMNCVECHDMWAKFVGDRNLYVTSDFGSTGRDSLLKVNPDA